MGSRCNWIEENIQIMWHYEIFVLYHISAAGWDSARLKACIIL